ncbi:MAG: hypothetical protein ACM3PY_10270 [Omnitrophica WOR_2 bacterium]
MSTLNIVRVLEWVFAAAGAMISMYFASSVFVSQAQFNQAPGESMWPLPGLVLVEWALLGLVGFLAIALSKPDHPARWNLAGWVICGALITMGIISAFSIGPIVLTAALLFFFADILLTYSQKIHVLQGFGTLLIGLVGNGAILFVLLVFAGTIKI